MTYSGKDLDLSFVVLTWNSEQHIKNCLHSIENSLYDSKLTYDVYIIDNGSSDGTLKIIDEIRSDFPVHLNLIKLDRNTGTTYSRNLALKKTKSRYVCIMDSDVILIKGVVEKLVHNLVLMPEVVLSAPKLIYPNGWRQKSTDHFPTLLRKIIRYFFLKLIERLEEKQQRFDKLVEVDYAISALWVLKRDVVNDVGLFDENINYAPEDVDYCLRIWKAGYRILYDPSVSAIHFTQEITRNFMFSKLTMNHLKGLFYYFKKHRYFFRSPVFPKREISVPEKSKRRIN